MRVSVIALRFWCFGGVRQKRTCKRIHRETEREREREREKRIKQPLSPTKRCFLTDADSPVPESTRAPCRSSRPATPSPSPSPSPPQPRLCRHSRSRLHSSLSPPPRRLLPSSARCPRFQDFLPLPLLYLYPRRCLFDLSLVSPCCCCCCCFCYPCPSPHSMTPPRPVASCSDRCHRYHLRCCRCR